MSIGVLAPECRRITVMVVAPYPQGRGLARHLSPIRAVREVVIRFVVVPIGVAHMITTWLPEGPVPALIDDTGLERSDCRSEGIWMFRDAVGSTGLKVAYSLDLNLVVATPLVDPPWSGC